MTENNTEYFLFNKSLQMTIRRIKLNMFRRQVFASHLKGCDKVSIRHAGRRLLPIQEVVFGRHCQTRSFRARGPRRQPPVDAEEADEGRPEAEADHAVDDEVDARVEDEAEDVEARQDPHGHGGVESASRLAVVEVTATDRRRVNDGVDLQNDVKEKLEK